MTGWACVARLGGVGDNLIASSVLRPLKRLGYMTEVITSDHCHTVFLNNPHLDKLTVKGDGDVPGGEDWHKWFASRAKEYDMFANFSHSCEVRHALQVSQTAFWWPAEYRRKLCAGSYLETVHDIIGVPHEFGPLFFPTDEERARAAKTKKDVGGRFVAWVISGSQIDKIHPYAALAIARIIKEIGVPVVMIGVGGKQFEMAREMMQHVGRQNSVKGRSYIDAQGLHTADDLHLALSPDGADPGGAQHWSIRRSLSLALAADLVVTPDTGVAWATAMEPIPKVVTLSHASAENIVSHWRNTIALHADPDVIPCWSCHRLHNDISTCTPNKDLGKAAACIADISVELLLTAVKAGLGSKSSLAQMQSEWASRVTLQDFPASTGTLQMRFAL